VPNVSFKSLNNVEFLYFGGKFHNKNIIKINRAMMPPRLTMNKDTLNTKANTKATIRKTIRAVKTVVFTSLSFKFPDVCYTPPPIHPCLIPIQWMRSSSFHAMHGLHGS
jgi:hypothetical protein